MNSIRFVVLAAIGGLMIGCGGSGPDPAQVQASVIIIEFPTGDPLRVTGGSIKRTPINDGLSVEVKNGRLLVNDKDHGAVQGGDKVKIEAGNAVKVNGEARQPGR